MSLYAILMALSLVGPLALSFDRKVAFYKSWIPLFIGICVNALLFIVWDGWFVRTGVWSFNPDYVWSLRINDLPIEEWSFFLVIPYCSIFIYACLKVYVKNNPLEKFAGGITFTFWIITLLLLIIFYDRTYTFYNSLFAFLLLTYHLFWGKKNYMAYFWLAYFIHLIPFAIVNGVLTAKPVVIYNNLETIGLRLGTIPVEDTVYALTCLLLPLTLMEYFLERKKSLAQVFS